MSKNLRDDEREKKHLKTKERLYVGVFMLITIVQVCSSSVFLRSYTSVSEIRKFCPLNE
ncbi:hypothetical protein AKA01nite_03260 [Alkalibacterium kapii]|uniref:Uncharacterized protein n=1 Tax=Alkalibacterium kapii TaxID=426704 RepID=A0A511AR70_9LACT|nr:hypothetical protein AKA01nite_03260 [Alkalibacterium kapii]